MKFVCDGLTLSEAAVKTGKACAVRTTAPILECIKLCAGNDEVTLFATDGELSIQKTIRAEVFEEGEVCVPGKLFCDFIGKLTSVEVTIQTSDRGIEIKYLDSGTYMQVLSADEFPKISLDIGKNSFVLKKRELKQVVAKTSFCCATDDSRPILKGCLMEFGEQLEMTALDGYRLAYATAEIVSKTGANSIVCPARTLVEISRMIDESDEEITLYTQGGMLLVRTEDMIIVSRLYQGDFIKRSSVVPVTFSTLVTLSKTELLESVERAAILIRGDKNNLVTLTIGGNMVKIASVSEQGTLSESIAAGTEGKELVISMNAKFLTDALKALEEESVQIAFNGPVSPFVLENSEKKGSFYLILPVRNVQ